jgi:hypothetical protein
MTHVEHFYPGFQWAEPEKGNYLSVEISGDELLIEGLFPGYQGQDSPSDLMSQYGKARLSVRRRPKRAGSNSPHILFANADTDERLLSFVRLFGPVVAQTVSFGNESPWHLRASQDLQELRNEQIIYHAVFRLIKGLTQTNLDYQSAQQWIKQIADHIGEWRKQWRRERSNRGHRPPWHLSMQSIRRVQQFGSAGRDYLLSPAVDCRIVICELLNTFPARVFPNPLETHSSINHGIRPLLYALLRREFLHPHDTGVCANTQCRALFEIERAKQRFCTNECSLSQRQREYWSRRGSKVRRLRRKDAKKAQLQNSRQEK